MSKLGRLALITLLCGCVGSLAPAQDGGKSRGKSGTYVKVVVNGEVVEEHGDPKLMSLLDDLLADLELPEGARDLLDRKGRRAGAKKRAAGSAKKSASSSHSRRVVVRNGKTIVDEEIIDGKPVKPGAAPRKARRAPSPAIEDLKRRARELEAEAKKARGSSSRSKKSASSRKPKVGPKSPAPSKRGTAKPVKKLRRVR